MGSTTIITFRARVLPWRQHNAPTLHLCVEWVSRPEAKLAAFEHWEPVSGRRLHLQARRDAGGLGELKNERHGTHATPDARRCVGRLSVLDVD